MTDAMRIHHDFTDVEAALATAAYAAYHQGRACRPWDALHGHERFRWLLAGWVGHTGPEPATAEVLRATYHIGTHQPAWSEVRPEFRRRWQRATRAAGSAAVERTAV